MDYTSIAKELLNLRAGLMHIPANKNMNEFAKGELYVLNYLNKHDGTAYPKDISREMYVSTARIAAILGQMERKGWVTRISDKEDTRQVIVTLTQSGYDYLVSKEQEIIASVINMLKDIGENDARELLRIQRKMMKKI